VARRLSTLRYLERAFHEAVKARDAATRMETATDCQLIVEDIRDLLVKMRAAGQGRGVPQ